MESAGTVVQLAIGVFGAVWLYGTSSDRKKARFKEWLSGLVLASKPHLLQFLARGALLLIAVAAGVIVWGSAKDVYEFKTSLEPLTRPDVFKFLLNSFNALAYLLAGSVFLGMAFSRPNSKSDQGKLVITIKEQETFVLGIAEDADSGKLIEAIKLGQASFQVTSASRGRTKLVIDAPEGLRVNRAAQTKITEHA